MKKTQYILMTTLLLGSILMLPVRGESSEILSEETQSQIGENSVLDDKVTVTKEQYNAIIDLLEELEPTASHDSNQEVANLLSYLKKETAVKENSEIGEQSLEQLIDVISKTDQPELVNKLEDILALGQAKSGSSENKSAKEPVLKSAEQSEEPAKEPVLKSAEQSEESVKEPALKSADQSKESAKEPVLKSAEQSEESAEEPALKSADQTEESAEEPALKSADNHISQQDNGQIKDNIARERKIEIDSLVDKKVVVQYKGKSFNFTEETGEEKGLENYEAPEVDENNQGTLGSNIKSSHRLYSTPRVVNSAEKGLPGFDFIDISSHQGEYSVAEFKNLKKQGVRGVIVKLTEATSYVNPYALSQINNAKKAGLKVSVYHFSWFTNKASAEAEARYFARAAKRMGLGKDTVMVNDAEQEVMNNGRITQNSVYFSLELNKVFAPKAIIHYSFAEWFEDKTMNLDVLGGVDQAWVPDFVPEPTNTPLLHRDAAAWQWGDTVHFVGDQSWRLTDVNIDYSGIFTNEQANGITEKPLNQKMFFKNGQGRIYTEPKTQKKYFKETTVGLSNNLVTVTKEVKNLNNTWYQIDYINQNRKERGWIKAHELKNFIKNNKVSKKVFINTDTGVLYSRAYVPGAKNLGRTMGMKNKVATVTEEATTGYGKWYKVTYTQLGEKKTGWLKANELSNFIENNKVSKKVFINKNTAVLYNRAYIPGAKNLGRTTGMKNKVVTVTEEATTGYGKWYKIMYKHSGEKRTGWLNVKEVANFIDNNKMNNKMFVTKNTAVLYSRAYIPGAKNLGVTKGMANKPVDVLEEAKTGYGEWYQVSYTNESGKHIGWLRKTELIDSINNRVLDDEKLINKNTAVLYDRAYTPGAKNLGRTTGLKGVAVKVTAVSETCYGIWYQTSYSQNKQFKTGWLKATDLN